MTELPSKEEILSAPEKDYMNDSQLAYFRQALIELHESTVARILEVKEQMTLPHDLSEGGDLASWQEQSSIMLRIVDREQKFLPKIRDALQRIRNKTYGYCLESGEPIGIPRLLARPTVEYSADIKALKEIKEGFYQG